MLDTTSPIPFDFLVNGSFLRTSLEDYLKANGLSSESTITLQYVRSLIPPVYQASFEHDDWVRDIDVLSASSRAGIWSGDHFTTGQERILSASDDGILRIWDGSGNAIATSSPTGLHGHANSIKAAKFLSSSQIASSGQDATIRIWKYAEANDHLSGTFKQTLQLCGHKTAVNTLDVHGPTGRILSTSVDGNVGLWTTSKSSAPAVQAPEADQPSSKKAKLSSSVSQRGPLSLTRPHNLPASAAVFDPADSTIAYTSSLDHTIRTLDLTTSKVENVITTSHPLFSLCALRRNGNSLLLAAGNSARHVTLVDPRASAALTSVMTLRGHRNIVSGLAPCPDNDHSLVSASYDGTCRIWDLRSVRPATRAEGGGSVCESVHTIQRESSIQKTGGASDVPGRGAKLFGVAWDAHWGIVSGGEDKVVQINRGRDLLAAAE